MENSNDRKSEEADNYLFGVSDAGIKQFIEEKMKEYLESLEDDYTSLIKEDSKLAVCLLYC